jgi:DNA repair protein RadC
LEQKNLTIKHWAEDDRPREKMASKGAQHLSHAELLAIIINNGSKDKSALELAKEILSLAKNNLDELGKLELKDFKTIKGIGNAKAIAIAAALELGRRRSQEDALQKDKIINILDAVRFLRAKLKDYKHEVFAVLYLNKGQKILDYKILSTGGIDATHIEPKMVLQPALQLGATSIIVCHNHPGGNLTPSTADKKITEKLKQATELLDMKLIDHIIVTDDSYFSFEQEKML